MLTDSLSKSHLASPIVVCLVLPALVGVVLKWPRSGPPDTLETALAQVGVIPSDASTFPAVRRTTGLASTNPLPINEGAAKQPWWASLTPAEVKVREEDFEFLYDQPGAFPEFSEITRQLTEAGVPIQIVRLESREIFGALLQRRMYAMSSAEFQGAAEPDTSEEMKEANRLMASVLSERAAVGEAEVVSRLTNNGVALDSEPARRIR